ncbi:MAG: flagellar type III secretion system pore protein FliP [Actinomycetota bacterium]|nr:flagellar type III secretion system pore protein FliP [Actinomycetota bacterium]
MRVAAFRTFWIISLGVALALSALTFGPRPALAQPEIPIPSINLGVGEAETPQDVAVSLQILFLITILSLAPAILIMTTSFMRIAIVLSFVRNALGTQQVPPSQVIVGLALFLTLFIMAPVFNQINTEALGPYLNGEVDQAQAIETATGPLRTFMFKQTREKDLALFVSLAKMERPKAPSDIPTHVLIPAFIISELKTAFIMGFLIYIPFLVIDMIIASILMSMGMMMLPPIMISLPLKLLLFVMVDGWHLITRSLVMGFR